MNLVEGKAKFAVFLSQNPNNYLIAIINTDKEGNDQICCLDNELNLITKRVSNRQISALATIPAKFSFVIGTNDGFVEVFNVASNDGEPELIRIWHQYWHHASSVTQIAVNNKNQNFVAVLAEDGQGAILKNDDDWFNLSGQFDLKLKRIDFKQNLLACLASSNDDSMHYYCLFEINENDMICLVKTELSKRYIDLAILSKDEIVLMDNEEALLALNIDSNKKLWWTKAKSSSKLSYSTYGLMTVSILDKILVFHGSEQGHIDVLVQGQVRERLEVVHEGEVRILHVLRLQHDQIALLALDKNGSLVIIDNNESTDNKPFNISILKGNEQEEKSCHYEHSLLQKEQEQKLGLEREMHNKEIDEINEDLCSVQDEIETLLKQNQTLFDKVDLAEFELNNDQKQFMSSKQEKELLDLRYLHEARLELNQTLAMEIREDVWDKFCHPPKSIRSLTNNNRRVSNYALIEMEQKVEIKLKNSLDKDITSSSKEIVETHPMLNLSMFAHGCDSARFVDLSRLRLKHQLDSEVDGDKQINLLEQVVQMLKSSFNLSFEEVFEQKRRTLKKLHYLKNKNEKLIDFYNLKNVNKIDFDFPEILGPDEDPSLDLPNFEDDNDTNNGVKPMEEEMNNRDSDEDSLLIPEKEPQPPPVEVTVRAALDLSSAESNLQQCSEQSRYNFEQNQLIRRRRAVNKSLQININAKKMVDEFDQIFEKLHKKAEQVERCVRSEELKIALLKRQASKQQQELHNHTTRRRALKRELQVLHMEQTHLEELKIAKEDLNTDLLAKTKLEKGLERNLRKELGSNLDQIQFEALLKIFKSRSSISSERRMEFPNVSLEQWRFLLDQRQRRLELEENIEAIQNTLKTAQTMLDEEEMRLSKLASHLESRQMQLQERNEQILDDQFFLLTVENGQIEWEDRNIDDYLVVAEEDVAKLNSDIEQLAKEQDELHQVRSDMNHVLEQKQWEQMRLMMRLDDLKSAFAEMNTIRLTKEERLALSDLAASKESRSVEHMSKQIREWEGHYEKEEDERQIELEKLRESLAAKRKRNVAIERDITKLTSTK